MVMALDNIRRGTMLLTVSFVVLVVLALIQTIPGVSSLGLDETLYWEAVVAKQAGKPQYVESSSAFKVDLMPFHHEKSPYAKPNLSLEERVAIAVKSSRARAEFFASEISRKTGFSSKAVFTSPVFSNQGSYLMQLELGTPAKRFVAIADTGSDLVWVQCAPCGSCYAQPDALFDPSLSSSYTTTTCTNALCNAVPRRSCTPDCQYQYGYGDQSTTQGAFSLETLTLTSSSGGAVPFANFGFGCGTQNQGTFSGTDGLVGLGQGSLSLISQLGSQFGNVFSYCLVSFYSPKTSSLLLGGGGGSVGYTPLVTNPSNPSFYYVNLVGILVGGSPLSIPASSFNGGFILDSGTTITQLQNAAYAPLVNTMSSLISYPRVDGSSIGFDLCYDLSGAANPTVPTVTFQFEGLEVDLPANNIFLQVTNGGVFCLAFQGSGFGFGIFGNVQQQNFNIEYNRASNVIGFAPTTC